MDNSPQGNEIVSHHAGQMQLKYFEFPYETRVDQEFK